MFGRASTSANATASTTLMFHKKISVATGTTTATIVWSTNASTTGEVRFSTSTPVAATSSMILDNSFGTNHSIQLTGLNASTKYYVTITARDGSGNVKTSAVMRFHTKSASSSFMSRTLLQWWYDILD